MNTTQTMTRIEINRELDKLRFEREKAQREVDNIQACMNALMMKRNELDLELKHGDLFTALFGDERGQDSAFMDDNFGG